MTLVQLIEGALAEGRYRVPASEYGIDLIVQPEVTLISASRFTGIPEDLRDQWETDIEGEGGELLLDRLLGLRFGLHVPGLLERAGPRLAEAHDGLSHDVLVAMGMSEVIGDEERAHDASL